MQSCTPTSPRAACSNQSTDSQASARLRTSLPPATTPTFRLDLSQKLHARNPPALLRPGQILSWPTTDAESPHVSKKQHIILQSREQTVMIPLDAESQSIPPAEDRTDTNQPAIRSLPPEPSFRAAQWLPTAADEFPDPAGPSAIPAHTPPAHYEFRSPWRGSLRST